MDHGGRSSINLTYKIHLIFCFMPQMMLRRSHSNVLMNAAPIVLITIWSPKFYSKFRLQSLITWPKFFFIFAMISLFNAAFGRPWPASSSRISNPMSKAGLWLQNIWSFVIYQLFVVHQRSILYSSIPYFFLNIYFPNHSLLFSIFHSLFCIPSIRCTLLLRYSIFSSLLRIYMIMLELLLRTVINLAFSSPTLRRTSSFVHSSDLHFSFKSKSSLHISNVHFFLNIACTLTLLDLISFVQYSGSDACKH